MVHIHVPEGATQKIGQVRELLCLTSWCRVYPEKDQKEFGYDGGKLPYEAKDGLPVGV